MKRGKPILQVLGAGRLQKKTIKQAEDAGVEVVAVDSDQRTQGKSFATYKSHVSTLDYKANLKIAREYNIDGILTTGTDQPVIVAAKIANRLHLPSFISVNTALLVTNKEKMKEAFKRNNIPSPQFRVIKNPHSVKRLKYLKFPVVIKPIDSQGQKGVFFIENFEMLHRKLKLSFNFSKVKKVIIEDYVEGPEVTANVWVHKGKPYLLLLTDRITYNNFPHIGLCMAHIFPSKHARKYTGQIENIIKKLTEGFKINNGPVYIQMIISKEGPLFGEVACRVGGGHEEDLIPIVTGFDIRGYLIDFTIRGVMDFNEKSFVRNNPGHYAVFFVGAKKDTALDFRLMEEQIESNNFLCGEFYIRNGIKVNDLHVATDRIGFFIVKGRNRKDLLNNGMNIYSQLKIPGKKHRNIIENIFNLDLNGI